MRVEMWELQAREAIRDLVARYNANGDSGRFAQVLELFAPDAQMVLDDGVRTGHDEIRTIFTGAKDDLWTAAGAPTYVRHVTGTHQIDLIDTEHATGRLYFQVITSVGLDHWGRYVDQYRVVDGRWRFARRTVTVDGYHPASLFPQPTHERGSDV
jgi:uncharacterized protein (TIGR02246 family)